MNLSPNKESVVNSLFTYLKNDQSHSGIHRGQFGSGQRIAEEEKYQTTKEKLDTKPRLYLTGWTVFILHKHNDKLPVDELLEVTKLGILDLLEDGWVYISMDALPVTHPDFPRHKGIISYRHTIRAAQIILAVDNNQNVIKTILGRILDSSADLQTTKGGWRQCNIVFREEDLWGSAYAVGFLYECIRKASSLNLDKNALSRAESALVLTLDWLNEMWETNSLVYGEVSTEENLPIIFPEIINAAIKYHPRFAFTILSHLKSYRNPTYQPSINYLNKNSLIGPCASSTRLAYNFFLARNFQEYIDIKWIVLRDYALQHIESGYNCVEAAMLLDMLLTNDESDISLVGI